MSADTLSIVANMQRTTKYRDPVIQRIRSERGLQTRVASACGRSRQAVSLWTRVPTECVPAVAALLKMKPADIRPDLPELFGRR